MFRAGRHAGGRQPRRNAQASLRGHGPARGTRGRADAPAPGVPAPYFFFAAAAPASAEPAPRIALKKSLLESMTITSDFLLKLAR